ncbi:MAG TPA: NADH-ubiquinone oxidoreductase-F iron-sulfur binding region domain-containing protein [Candidatus Limnocylindria bacterium]|jgi:NADH:ubiquinone oxidoreductase subunit F (NADH-binding)|nr:NADH-ubiquinone oxidoreductase-F iron-sulfur binding region domain-containing protein [Candidatus Limnocylindria bacterium]
MPASTTTRLLEGARVPALDRALDADAAIEQIVASGLRGRGGAGFALADKLRAVRANAAGGDVYVVANAYDADPGSPLARTLLQGHAELVVRGIEIAMVITGASRAFLYLHPEATDARSAAERALADRDDIEIALGPGGFMGGEESALLNVLESKRAMARQRPPYPALQGYLMRPTLVSSAETLAWLPLVLGGAKADTKLVSVTGIVATPGVYEVPLGTTLGDVLERAGGVTAELKGVHVGGPTGGILSPQRLSTRLDYDALKAAGTHLGSGQVRALGTDVCMVREAGRLFAYLAKESCAICVPCRVGTKRVQGILEGVSSSVGRDADLPWLTELGDHMERFSLCGFGITAPSILRTTMREFADDYAAHITERRCPTGTCTTLRARRYETMVQP